MTLADIDKICDAFAAVLNGVFHERIEYPAITAEQLRRQYPVSRALPPSEESPVEAMELVRMPEVDPQEAEHAADEVAREAAEDTAPLTDAPEADETNLNSEAQQTTTPSEEPTSHEN